MGQARCSAERDVNFKSLSNLSVSLTVKAYSGVKDIIALEDYDQQILITCVSRQSVDESLVPFTIDDFKTVFAKWIKVIKVD